MWCWCCAFSSASWRLVTQMTNNVTWIVAECCFSVWYGAFHQVMPWNDTADAWHSKAGQYAMGLCHRSAVSLVFLQWIKSFTELWNHRNLQIYTQNLFRTWCSWDLLRLWLSTWACSSFCFQLIWHESKACHAPAEHSHLPLYAIEPIGGLTTKSVFL